MKTNIDDFKFKGGKIIMIKFYKVSYEQFKKDYFNGSEYSDLDDEELLKIYNNIKLPKRATKGSAGYDFFAPYDLKFKNGRSLKFPTGIRCEMDEDTVLILVPRSSLGFKYRLGLNNTLGVIDSDYAFAKNEGHIQCKMNYDDDRHPMIAVYQGEAYMQGIFINYLKTDDDETDGIRTGGIGSTNGNDK